MANKKYKLTDGNYWATDGVYDLGQSKTQRTINSDVQTALGGKAPTDHSKNDTTYGKGTDTKYGHVKISDSLTDTTTAATGGVVPSMKAVSDLNGAITNLKASEVANDSNVSGAKVKDALNTLQAVTTGFGTDFFSETDASLQGMQWIRQGKVVTVYMLFVNEAHSTLSIQHPTVKADFRPDLVSGNYIIAPIYNATSPYEIAGSLWLYGDGSCYTYLIDLTKRPQYCSFTYITK